MEHGVDAAALAASLESERSASIPQRPQRLAACRRRRDMCATGERSGLVQRGLGL